MAVRPFQFTGMPRYTKEQVALQESMAVYLSYKPLRPSFRHALADTIGSYLKTPCEISAPTLKTVNRYEIGALLPATGCLVQVGLGNEAAKILVDLDPTLAMLVIERLLGGEGDTEKMRRPLTEIEEGVLSFILLRTLKQFHSAWETGREHGLTLDRVAPHLDAYRDLLDQVALFAMLGVHLNIGRYTGYARIFIPSNLAQKSFATLPEQGGGNPKEHAYMLQVLRNLRERNVDARLEITHLDLSSDDVVGVERGDIIVLERHQLTLGETGVSGEVFVRIGSGQNGGFRGRVFNEGGTARLQVTDIVQQEQPQEGAMADKNVPTAEDNADAEGDTDNLIETEGLLRDIPSPVVVELGRLRLNTSQVVRLRSGQILRLHRGPNDPVDLVINDKLFARGELVEVEGELGVRLLHVVGAG